MRLAVVERLKSRVRRNRLERILRYAIVQSALAGDLPLASAVQIVLDLWIAGHLVRPVKPVKIVLVGPGEPDQYSSMPQPPPPKGGAF